MNESADIWVSLASLSDFLSNVDICIDSFVVDLILSSGTSEVNDDVGVLDCFVIESVIVVVKVTHDITLTRTSAKLQFLDEVIICVDMVVRENDVTANVA